MTEELRVSESIAIGLKRVAIILAEDLDYSRAAEKLGLTSVELRKQISALEAQLYFHIFKPRQKTVELTEEGQFLIEVFRKSVALHDRNGSKGPGDVR
jgi:DNA-binding transcriptional LysR family regulator